MQTNTKQSKQSAPEEKLTKQAVSKQSEKPTAEAFDNANVENREKEAEQQDQMHAVQPAENDLVNETMTPQTIEDDSAKFVLPADSPAESDETIDLDELEEVLAGFLDEKDFVAGNSNHAARQLNAALAVVNHENGKRSKVRKDVLQKLNIHLKDIVKVTVKNKQVILLKSLDGKGIQVKTGGYLYNSELVEAITKEFAFDFSNQSTHHLLNVTYKKWNNQVVAIITL